MDNARQLKRACSTDDDAKKVICGKKQKDKELVDDTAMGVSSKVEDENTGDGGKDKQRIPVSATEASLKIIQQQDKICSLIAGNAVKADIYVELEILVELKKNYKAITEKDWKASVENAIQVNSTVSVDVLLEKLDARNRLIDDLGHQKLFIAQLRACGAGACKIEEEEKFFSALKLEFKCTTGEDYGASNDKVVPCTTCLRKCSKNSVPAAPHLAPYGPHDVYKWVGVFALLENNIKFTPAPAKVVTAEKIDAETKKLQELKAVYKQTAHVEYPFVMGPTRVRKRAREPLNKHDMGFIDLATLQLQDSKLLKKTPNGDWIWELNDAVDPAVGGIGSFHELLPYIKYVRKDE